MRPTQVFILYDHPLFARGLERLLRGVRHLTVLGSATWREVEALPEGAVQADVVILEKPRGASEPDTTLTRLLASRPEARVLRLSLEDNEMTIYSAQSLTATQQSDLVRALKAGKATRGTRNGGQR